MTAKERAYVYILATKSNRVLYVGSTTNLAKRVYFHKKRLLPGFTRKYNVDKLVYFETLASEELALQREAQLKGYRRQKKVDLINHRNPRWRDLFLYIYG